jgi:superfamily II DNA or RNA helicase
MPSFIRLDDISAFDRVKSIPLSSIQAPLRESVRQLHEADDIEEFIRAILSDRAATPHGPAELVDILTHRVALDGTSGIGAFILKGRSFPTVRPKDIAHQIYRLEKIDGLSFAALGATGIVLDAVKEQFTSTCERLKISYTFLDADDFSRLFWAYGFLCPRDGTRIKGGRCHCGYAPDHAVLNILQDEALRELKRSHELRQTKGLVVLPPGSGKTRIAARDAKDSGAKRVLYVAHTHEILEVARSEFSAAFHSEHVIELPHYQPGAETFVLISTIQYLHNKLDDIEKIPFDYVVFDEFHHAAARTYRKADKRLNYKFLLGLTATPFRGDRKDIAALCDHNIVVQYELRSGIETGILTPYHYYGCFDDINYDDIAISDRGYSARDLERKLVIKERHEAIVKKWREKAFGLPTLAFCCSLEHAEKVASAFRRAGVGAECYVSTTPPAERLELLDRLRRGDVQVLCTVDVLNEGADIPFIECLLFLRPTESKRIFVQQLGRGLRKYVGKSHCLVIDFIGNFQNAYRIVEYHGLGSDEFEEGSAGWPKSIKGVLDLPLGCKVTFDDRVLTLFADQTLDPKNATRENIGRILIHRFSRLRDILGRMPTKKDIDRNELLDSTFYTRVFGSWKKFMLMVEERER